MLWNIICFILLGLVAGAIARLLVPGRDRMGLWMTALLGMVGSFVGGFLGYVLFHHDRAAGGLQASGIFGSVVGAIIVLLVYRRFGRKRRYARSYARR